MAANANAGNLRIPAIDPAQLGMVNPFAAPVDPPPSPSLGFQAWASDPRNAMKVTHAMTRPDAPLQPNAARSAASGAARPQVGASASPQIDTSALDAYERASAAGQQAGGSAGQQGGQQVAVPAIQQAGKPASQAGATRAMPAMPASYGAAQSRLDADVAEMERLKNSGAGVNKIKNPALRFLARAGDIAAPFIVGRGAMAIPGTTAHNIYLQREQAGRVGADQDAMQKELQGYLDQANLAHTQAQTAQMNMPGPPAEKPITLNTDAGILEWDGKQWAPVQVNGKTVMPPERAGTTHPFQRVAGTSGGKRVFANYDPMTGKFTGVDGKPLTDFEPADKSMQGALGGFAPAFMAYRMLQQAVETNPALLPYVAPLVARILAQSGAPQAGLVDTLSQPPAGQPQDDKGNPLGLKMPAAPTSQTRSRGQFAQATIPAIESAKKEIQRLGDQLGPAQGRWNELYTGKIGAYGPQFSALQTTLKNVGTAWMRLHANSESARQDFEKMLSTSKDPANLVANLNAIENQARDYVAAGQGRPGTMGGSPYQAPAHASMQRFTDKGVVYHIPANMVQAFRKDHPNAR